MQNAVITECINDMNDSLDIVKAHVKETGNTHGLTLFDLGIPNVENKSSSDIRGEITKQNIVDALGYTPSNESDMQEPTQVDDSSIKYNPNNQLYAPFSHTHTNKSVLDMLCEKDGKLMFGDTVVSDISEYIERIESLEIAIELMNRSIKDGLSYTILQTEDGTDIVTNDNNKILCVEE